MQRINKKACGCKVIHTYKLVEEANKYCSKHYNQIKELKNMEKEKYKIEGFEEFKIALGKRESDNNYQCKNKWGYLGRWQFGKMRLYDCGLSLNGYKSRFRIMKKHITEQGFLSNEKLQDEIFELHTRKWLKVIRRKYKKYLGKVVNGIIITESGCVAGLHLKGEGSAKYPGLKQFLKKGIDGNDALGTKISEYILKFSDYDLTAL